MLQYIGYLIVLIISLIAYVFTEFIGTTGSTGAGVTILGGGHNKEQLEVARKYKQFKDKGTKLTFNDFCYPKSYSIQRQQKFAGEYMKPGSGHNAILVVHRIGAGKTCLSIQVGEQWISKGRPLIVLPASLIPSFRNELRTPCAGNNYITEEERSQLKLLRPSDAKYKELVELSNKRIDKAYQIFSYNKFATEYKSVDAPIIIVDEVQNVANLGGVFYNSILAWVEKHKKVPVVLMSATPVFDNPRELAPICKLMRVDLGDDFTPDTIREKLPGKVTFFKGAPEFTYPKTLIKIQRCKMSRHQARWYKSEVESEMNKLGDIKTKAISDDFYIKSRQRANVVAPHGLTSTAGIKALTPAIIKSSLATYSCKLAKMMKKLRRGTLSAVYTTFTGIGGISTITKVLKAHGYSDFAVDGPGKKRFAIFSGEETGQEKDRLRAVFNSPENDDASQIQIVIGSPAMKEGISLMRVRQMHILDLYWNMSRLEQIWGRVVRYCSHKSLPKADRDVTIYLYAAVTADTPRNMSLVTPLQSVDLYMLNIAEEKRDANDPYIDAIMDVAVDRLLHYPDS